MFHKNRAALILVLAATTLVIGPAYSASDSVKDAWLKRVELAKRKIAAGKLDACDRGLEQAFLNVKEKPGKPERLFILDADISGLKLQFGYGFTGNSVSSFFLSEIPAKSLAVQKPSSRTVSILVAPVNCALDLCATDPFSDGPCRSR